MWHSETYKPVTFENILVFTSRKYMIEAFWNGKIWISQETRNEIQCEYWRALPKLVLPLKEKKKKCKTKKVEKRHIPKVTFDERGRMHTCKQKEQK